MLFQFFDTDSDKSVFEELVSEYMGKYPVIFLSLKSIEGSNFESSMSMMKILMRDEVKRIKRKIREENLSKEENEYLSSFINLTASIE